MYNYLFNEVFLLHITPINRGFIGLGIVMSIFAIIAGTAVVAWHLNFLPYVEEAPTLLQVFLMLGFLCGACPLVSVCVFQLPAFFLLKQGSVKAALWMVAFFMVAAVLFTTFYSFPFVPVVHTFDIGPEEFFLGTRILSTILAAVWCTRETLPLWTRKQYLAAIASSVGRFSFWNLCVCVLLIIVFPIALLGGAPINAIQYFYNICIALLIG